MTQHGYNVASALQRASVARLDERGLMPLDEARRVLASADTFRDDEQRDALWAALLSLEDPAELVREAQRLRWQAHVSGPPNSALIDRYGDGALPWIASRVGQGGVLRNVPSILAACLVELAGEAPFALALRVRAVVDDVGGERRGDELDEASAPMIADYVARHPALGLRLLAGPAIAGNARSLAALALVAAEDPSAAYDVLDAALGAGEADGVLAGVGVARPTLPASTSALLDGAPTLDVPRGPAVGQARLDRYFREFEAPFWDNVNYFCGGMRVTGFVSPDGDALVFQALVTGMGENNVRREVHAYGPRFPQRRYDDTWRASTVVMPDPTSPTDGGDTLHHTTGVVVKWGPDGDTGIAPAGGIPTSYSFALLGGRRVTLPFSLPPGARLDDKTRAGLAPTELLMLQLAAPPYRDVVFLDGEQLAASIGLPATSRALFQLDSWSHPLDGEPASASPDIAAMLEALRRRKCIKQVPVGDDAFAQIARRIALHGPSSSLAAWGPAGSPLE